MIRVASRKIWPSGSDVWIADERNNKKDRSHNEQGDANLKQAPELCELTESAGEIIRMGAETCWDTHTAATEYEHREHSYPASNAHWLGVRNHLTRKSSATAEDDESCCDFEL